VVITRGRSRSIGTRRRVAGLLSGFVPTVITALTLTGCTLSPAATMSPRLECERAGGTWMAATCEHQSGGGGAM
jgi:hypothetical protein